MADEGKSIVLWQPGNVTQVEHASDHTENQTQGGFWSRFGKWSRDRWHDFKEGCRNRWPYFKERLSTSTRSIMSILWKGLKIILFLALIGLLFLCGIMLRNYMFQPGSNTNQIAEPQTYFGLALKH